MKKRRTQNAIQETDHRIHYRGYFQGFRYGCSRLEHESDSCQAYRGGVQLIA
jgi:hypothetical protein